MDTNLKGVSFETAQQLAEPRPPMETEGLAKARQILDLATTSYSSLSKEAGLRSGTSPGRLPEASRLRKKKEEESKLDKAVSIGGHTLAGAGAGQFITGLAQGQHGRNSPNFHRNSWRGSMVGGALALAKKLHDEHKKIPKVVQDATKTAASPGQMLKATQQVGSKSISTGVNMAAPKALKIASISEEALSRAVMSQNTRTESTQVLNNLFGETAVKTRKDARSLLDNLLITANSAETMAPMLEKQSANPFFNKTGLTGIGAAGVTALTAGPVVAHEYNKAKKKQMITDPKTPSNKHVHTEKIKLSSVTPALDAALEEGMAKLSQVTETEAQRNFPELLKVASTNVMPSLKKVDKSMPTGPNPVKSTLSGGNA